jgi:catechol-2,3-dioxygenase
MGHVPEVGFVSVAGYHHHVDPTTWAGEGALAAPPGSGGLRLYTIELPRSVTWAMSSVAWNMATSAWRKNPEGWPRPTRPPTALCSASPEKSCRLKP